MAGVRELLQQHDLRPNKALGQHFLVDEQTLRRIVAAAELAPDAVVLEIGPGTGALTRHLAAAAGQVVAVELDRQLLPLLECTMTGCTNVHLVQGDIMALDPADLLGEQPYQVVANLPYGITSAVLRHLLEARRPPQRTVVTIQREVAERIVARDGRMSLLAVSVHFYGQPRLLFRLKPGAFYPPPEVESAVLRIDRHDHLPVPPERVDDYFRVVRAGFAQPRKQLHNSLAAGLEMAPAAVAAALDTAGIDPRLRAERLTLDDWRRLMEALV